MHGSQHSFLFHVSHQQCGVRGRVQEWSREPTTDTSASPPATGQIQATGGMHSSVDKQEVGIHPSYPGQPYLHPRTADLFPGSDSGHLSQHDADHRGCRAGTLLVSWPQTGLAKLPWGDGLSPALRCAKDLKTGLQEPEDTRSHPALHLGAVHNQGPSKALRPG